MKRDHNKLHDGFWLVGHGSIYYAGSHPVIVEHTTSKKSAWSPSTAMRGYPTREWQHSTTGRANRKHWFRVPGDCKRVERIHTGQFEPQFVDDPHSAKKFRRLSQAKACAARLNQQYKAAGAALAVRGFSKEDFT